MITNLSLFLTALYTKNSIFLFPLNILPLLNCKLRKKFISIALPTPDFTVERDLFHSQRYTLEFGCG